MSGTMILHAGGATVLRNELAQIPLPQATDTYFPVGHHEVLATVDETLQAAGFTVARERLAVARNGQRLFGILDLTAELAPGTSLAVGMRNSYDKSFPLGMLAGSRVLVCDNLAFSAELTVRRKHTRNGQDRFRKAIGLALGRLEQFQVIEARRIEAYQAEDIDNTTADAIITRAFRAGIVSIRTLPLAIKHWDSPEHEEFQYRSVWSMFNAFTSALGGLAQSNPQDLAHRTMQLRALLDPFAGIKGGDGFSMDAAGRPRIDTAVDHDDFNPEDN